MKKFLTLSALIAGGMWMFNQRSKMTDSSRAAPGSKKELITRALEAGTAMLQDKLLLDAINLYLNGFHFYSDDMGHQMEAHHYCTKVNEDFTQCVIFDGNTKDARLIGIEYIISERLFNTLPQEERKLWHSHDYEVTSGTLIAPGIPLAAEHKLMEKIIHTYGKTWHTWDAHANKLPLGIPDLMMGFTGDGQLQPQLVEDRDRRFRVSTSRRRDNRRDIPKPSVASGVNVWVSGRSIQLTLEEVPMKNWKRDEKRRLA